MVVDIRFFLILGFLFLVSCVDNSFSKRNVLFSGKPPVQGEKLLISDLGLNSGHSLSHNGGYKFMTSTGVIFRNVKQRAIDYDHSEEPVSDESPYMFTRNWEIYSSTTGVLFSERINY